MISRARVEFFIQSRILLSRKVGLIGDLTPWRGDGGAGFKNNLSNKTTEWQSVFEKIGEPVSGSESSRRRRPKGRGRWEGGEGGKGGKGRASRFIRSAGQSLTPPFTLGAAAPIITRWWELLAPLQHGRSVGGPPRALGSFASSDDERTDTRTWLTPGTRRALATAAAKWAPEGRSGLYYSFGTPLPRTTCGARAATRRLGRGRYRGRRAPTRLSFLPVSWPMPNCPSRSVVPQFFPLRVRPRFIVRSSETCPVVAGSWKLTVPKARLVKTAI